MTRASSIERELLQRVVHAPLDDAPRLVFADWLVGRGDPRGELILAQCELARAGDDLDAERGRRLHDQVAALLAAHEREWTAELRAILGRDDPNYHPARFVRGFVETLYVPADVFAASADAILAAAPVLRQADFTRPTRGRFDADLGRALASRAELRALRSVRLFALDLDDEPFMAFVGSPHLGGLGALELGANSLGPAAVQALLDAPFAANLATLDLWRNRVGDDGARLVATSSPSSVRHVSLGGNGIGQRGAMALAGSGTLVALESLKLAQNPIGDDGVCALVASGTLPGLRTLDLTDVGLTHDGVRRLSELAGLARLESLVLGSNDVGDLGARALALSRYAGSLIRLELDDAEIGDDGFAALAAAEAFGRLRELSLRYNRLTDAGVPGFVAARGLPPGVEIDLAYNHVMGDTSALYTRFGQVNAIGQGLR